MTEYYSIAGHRNCDPNVKECGFLVGALRAPAIGDFIAVGEEISGAKATHALSGMVTWSRTSQNKIQCYRDIVDVFLNSRLCFSCVYIPGDSLPKQGRCLVIYNMYRETLAPWLLAGDTHHLYIDADFDAQECGGQDCLVAYIGSSSCPATQGKKPSPNRARLQSNDLAVTISSLLSPRTTFSLEKCVDPFWKDLEQLNDILIGATAYSINNMQGSVAKLEIANRIAGGVGLFSLKELAEGLLSSNQLSIRQYKDFPSSLKVQSFLNKDVDTDPNQPPSGMMF